MDRDWLKAQLSANPHKSKADLAKALGLGPPAISKILNGTRQIKAQEYINMRKFFNLPQDGRKAAIGAYVLKPLSHGKELTEQSHPEGEWILPAHILNERTGSPSDQIRIFRVTDHFMEPEFRKGEHVLVDLADTAPTPSSVFALSDGFGCMIRLCEYVPRSHPAKIKISAHSALFRAQLPEAGDFTILGRVIAKLQWV